MRHPDTPSMADVADPLVCHFCGGPNMEHVDFGWYDCHDCSASLRYSRGEVVDTEGPEDLDMVSELLHELRNPEYIISVDPAGPDSEAVATMVTRRDTQVRRDASKTSRDAALKALPKSGTNRAKVHDFIVGRGPYGATDEEVQGALSMSPNSERPRRVELVRGGHVVDSGRTRLSDMGNDSIVWVSTEEQTDE